VYVCSLIDHFDCIRCSHDYMTMHDGVVNVFIFKFLKKNVIANVTHSMKIHDIKFRGNSYEVVGDISNYGCSFCNLGLPCK
jgi:hypothetical protein